MNRHVSWIMSGALVVAACDSGGTCDTPGATKDSNGDCSCPAGTHFENQTGNSDGLCANDSTGLSGADASGNRLANDAGRGMDAAKADGSVLEGGGGGDGGDTGESSEDAAVADAEVTRDGATSDASTVPVAASDAAVAPDTSVSTSPSCVSSPVPGSQCTEGIGECAATGTYNCQGTCSAVPKAKSTEVCDGKDNDCDGQTDEGLAVTWYSDCDSDQYPTANAQTASACKQPAATAGCGGWTQTAPVAGKIDCNDADASYHPAATFGFVEGGNGDLNCDGKTDTSAGILAYTVQIPTPTPTLCAQAAPAAPSCPSSCIYPYAVVPGFAGVNMNGLPVDSGGNLIAVPNGAPPRCSRNMGDVFEALDLVPDSPGSSTCLTTTAQQQQEVSVYFVVVKCM